MLYPRFLANVLRKRMQTFPVTLLVGPRQSGKTTLVKQLGKELNIDYCSFDDINNLISAQLDPIKYLDSFHKPLILDEVQRVPEIFLPLKVDIDNNRIPGRFILTGSANPLLVPKLGDALTGRMCICNMWPLSQGEILGMQENFLDRLFSQETFPTKFPPLSQEDLIKKLFIGGFPAPNIAKDEEERKVWCNNYLSLTLQKDIYDLSKIEWFAHMPALLYGLASRAGSTLNIEELSRIARTSSTSLRRYIQLLESLFLLYKLPSWSKNIDSQLTKAPKVHFSDSALLLHVLNLTQEQLLSNLSVLGHVVENFVVMECVKQATWSKTNPRLFHYRQEKGAEVDLVLESAGKIVGIEIKLSSIVRSDDLKGLLSLQKKAEKSFHQGIILNMGNRILPVGKGMLAVPLNALWTT